MNRFRTLTITAALAVLLATSATFAQGPGGPGGRRGGGPGFGPGAGLPIRQLNLSDAQREQVQALAKQYQADNKAAAGKLRVALNAQRAAVEAIPVNEPLIRSTTQELAEAQTEVALQHARMNAELFALLTPAQQEQVKKLQAERATRAQEQSRRRERVQPQ